MRDITPQSLREREVQSLHKSETIRDGREPISIITIVLIFEENFGLDMKGDKDGSNLMLLQNLDRNLTIYSA